MRANAVTTSEDDDDLARARRLVAARKAIYDYMKSHGDFTAADINEAHGELAFAQVTLDQLIGANNDNTAAIKALTDELKRQNEFAQKVSATQMAQSARALADYISGQIVSVGYSSASGATVHTVPTKPPAKPPWYVRLIARLRPRHI